MANCHPPLLKVGSTAANWENGVEGETGEMKTTRHEMKKLIILVLLSAIDALASPQANTLTFTNISGAVYTNVTVILIEKDGILFRLSDGANYGRVKFTNMSLPLQAQFGYDPEKIRKAQEDRLAQEKADREEQIARAKAAQYDSIKDHKFYIDPIDEFDFPKTEKAQTACKEIASELKGINKAIELGLNYTKFSDLLTEKVLAIEKIKDLRGDGIPRSFLYRVDECVDAYKESRHWWNEKINDKYPTTEALDEYFMREYWSKADLHLIYCIGIAGKDTGANTLALAKIAEMIKTEQDAVRDGTLAAKDKLDPTISNLTVDEISARLKTTLSATNTPSTGTQP